MRLTELSPRWLNKYNMEGVHIGITFLCPICLEQRALVKFEIGSALLGHIVSNP